MVGDTGVGKSSLIHSLLQSQSPPPSYTIGAEASVLVHDDVYVEFVDVGGAAAYSSARTVFFSPPIHGLILVHDVNNANSYVNLVSWLAEVEFGLHIHDLGHDSDDSLVLDGNGFITVPPFDIESYLGSLLAPVPLLVLGNKTDILSSSSSKPSSSKPSSTPSSSPHAPAVERVFSLLNASTASASATSLSSSSLASIESFLDRVIETTAALSTSSSTTTSHLYR